MTPLPPFRPDRMAWRRRAGRGALALARGMRAERAGSWMAGWWRIVRLGALLLVLALSPSTWRGAARQATARHVVTATRATLLTFSVLSALAGLVLIRIVWVTAQGYGLTGYTLEMVVRVLVLELIPLAAALYVALRYTMPQAERVALKRLPRPLPPAALRDALLPRALAGLHAVAMLAAASGVIALVLAYLVVYGATPWAYSGYTRTVGQVFDAPVAAIFVLKTLSFGLAVSLVPLASAVHDAPFAASRTEAELRALLRLFGLLLLIEAASLIGNYA